jgi:hypothetical protein
MKTVPDSRLLYKCPAQDFFCPGNVQSMSCAGLILSLKLCMGEGAAREKYTTCFEKDVLTIYKLNI